MSGKAGMVGDALFNSSLNGRRESVKFTTFKGIRLNHNHFSMHYTAHWHPEVEILYPMRGACQAVLNTKSITVGPGDVLIIAPGTLHSYEAKIDGERIVLLVDTSMLMPTVSLGAMLQQLDPYVLVTQAEYPELNAVVQELMRKVISEYDAPDLFSEGMILAYMLELLGRVGRSIVRSPEEATAAHSQTHAYDTSKMLEAATFIMEHIAEPLSVERIAGAVGFSKFYFSRIFKDFYGLSCHEYVMSRRLECAEQMLADEPQASMIDVALRSGFNSLSTFTRVFRKKHGVSPSDYKKRLERGR